MRIEFIILLDVSYYLDVGWYMEVKYHMYANELRMEFYFKLLNLFYRVEENNIGIHHGAKFKLATKVHLWTCLEFPNIDKNIITPT